MADMDKLMEFLKKEVPSNAGDLNDAINNMLKIIEDTRVSLKSKFFTMANNFFEDSNYNEIIKEFQSANKQLQNFKSNLNHFVNDDEKINSNIGISDDILIEENDTGDIAEDEEEEIEELEGKIDYKKYLVDNTKPYPLSSDFENTTPDSFSFRGETYKVKTYKDMLLKLCEILYEKDANTFKEIATWHQIRGRKKSYIVYESDKVAQTITNPLRFLNTKIILEGTTSTTQKIKIIHKMLEIYKISPSSVKIYLKSDRHPRHGQEPIGIYIDKSFDYKTEKEINLKNDNKCIENNSDIPIGKRVYDYFQDYFKDANQTHDIQNFLSKNWCKETFNISYPLLKEYDESKDLKAQTIPEGKSGAYYAQNPKLYINNKLYIIYMQWSEKTHRSRIEKWISENPISSFIPVVEVFDKFMLSKQKEKCIYYDYKKDLCSSLDNPLFNQPCDNVSSCNYYSEKIVYITSKEKLKNKSCPSCGLQAEYEYLEIEYNPDNNLPAVTKKLQTLICHHCNKVFINVDLYKIYIKNKNPDYLDVSFTKYDK